MFSYEFCEISKNNFFIEHLLWLLLNFQAEMQKNEAVFSLIIHLQLFSNFCKNKWPSQIKIYYPLRHCVIKSLFTVTLSQPKLNLSVTEMIMPLIWCWLTKFYCKTHFFRSTCCSVRTAAILPLRGASCLWHF